VPQTISSLLRGSEISSLPPGSDSLEPRGDLETSEPRSAWKKIRVRGFCSEVFSRLKIYDPYTSAAADGSWGTRLPGGHFARELHQAAKIGAIEFAQGPAQARKLLDALAPATPERFT
jgi:hypothetical protein